MPLLQSDWRSHILIWENRFEGFFKTNRIYLEYPWKISGIYKNGDRIRVQKNAVVERYATMPPAKFVTMGAFSYVRSKQIAVDFTCGRYCSVAPGIQLSDQEHPTTRLSTHPFTTHPHMVELANSEFGKEWRVDKFRSLGPPPIIEHDVWIGADAMIKRGVQISTGAVIAARSIVTKDVPPYAIVGGTPAKVIRYRFSDENIERLLLSQWWQYNYVDLPNSHTKDISRYLDELESLRLATFEPGKLDLVRELTIFAGAEA